MSYAVSSAWDYERIAFYAFQRSEKGAVPVYRFFHRENGGYFYTTSTKTRDWLRSDPQKKQLWKYHGRAFYAYAKKTPGTKPVYRFLNKNNGSYYYTISKKTRDWLLRDPKKRETWRSMGVGFYAFSKKNGNSLPVYRFYRPDKDAYYYLLNRKLTELGPIITVGLRSFTKSELRDNSFRIIASHDYVIKNKNGDILATIPAEKETRVKYDSDKNMTVYNSISRKNFNREVRFEAVRGRSNDIIFHVKRPSMTYNEYRGSLKLRYSDESKKIWLINTVPLEHYVWGMGEITGTGHKEYNRVMTIAYRTYAYWKIKYSTKYASEGFKVDATPGNQIYRGYDWEKRYPRIKDAAKVTRGKIIKYKGEIALTPYSSWTDGRTRSWEQRWGSKNYPWCQSVKDSYGKHPSLSTSELESRGNHMVGISAHGALDRADNGWGYKKILTYYYKGIKIVSEY